MLKQRASLSVCELEPRTVLSAAVSLSNGVLSVVADNAGDYITVQNQPGNVVEVLVASENGRTVDFALAQVASILFQGGNGTQGDYFANLTALPSTQMAGSNPGVNYLQGGTGNDSLVADMNPHSQSYLTDPNGTDTFTGGPGFVNMFSGPGNKTFQLGSGYTALYSIQATTNVITGHSTGRGYLIVNNGSQVAANLTNYQIVTFFQPGVSGTAPGSPSGPSAVLQNDANGNGILYLNQANGQTSTTFVVNQLGATLFVFYTDPANGARVFTFDAAQVAWIASFGPAGSNNTLINNTSINDVLYGGLPPGNHTIVGGTGINVLKGHSGTNILVAPGYYNDVSAGNGTDLVLLLHRSVLGSTAVDSVFAQPHAADIVRANQKSVSTMIWGLRQGDAVSGIPASINFQADANDSDVGQPADNDDYVFWSQFLRTRFSI